MTTIRSFVVALAWTPAWLRVWIGVLLGVLGLAPAAFTDQLAAVTVLVGFWLGVLSMLLLHGRFGYAQILGLAHVCWLPGLLLVGLEAVPAVPLGGYDAWLQAALVCGITSLAFDVVDVVRFARGDRAPTVRVPLPPG